MTTDTVFAVFRIAVLLLILAYAIHAMLQLWREDAEYDRNIRLFLATLADEMKHAWEFLETRSVEATIVKIEDDYTDPLTGDRYIHVILDGYDGLLFPCRGFDDAPQVGDTVRLVMPLDDIHYVVPV